MRDEPSLSNLFAEFSTDALDRWLAGQSPPDEAGRFRAYLAAVPGAAEWIADLKRQRLSAETDFSRDVVTRAAHALVAQRTGVFPGSTAENEQAVRGPRLLRREIAGLGTRTLRGGIWSLGVAAVTVVSVVLIGLHTSHPESTRVYATRFGEQATITLLDGTRVTLAPGSTLRLRRFGRSSRTVDLEGQAYFEVTHTLGASFQVRTGAISTRVLGTAFLVRHYAHDEQVHIAVAEGKVSVLTAVRGASTALSQGVLTAGHVGDVTDSTIVVNAITDLAPETDWLRGKLVFRRALVSDVLRTLSRWYGYQFRCLDSTLEHQNVTIALDAQSSSAALATLGQTLSVSMNVVGDTVTLTPRVSHPPARTPRTQGDDMWIPTREVGR